MLWEICMRAYAVGDIHGHIDLLKTAQALVAEDRARAGDAGDCAFETSAVSAMALPVKF